MIKIDEFEFLYQKLLLESSFDEIYKKMEDHFDSILHFISKANESKDYESFYINIHKAKNLSELTCCEAISNIIEQAHKLDSNSFLTNDLNKISEETIVIKNKYMEDIQLMLAIREL